MRRHRNSKLWQPSRWEAIAILCLLALSWLHETLIPAVPRMDGVEVQQAWVQFVLMIVAYVLSAALAPKPKPPEAEVAQIPRVEDGARVVRIFGTVWRDNPAQAAMQQVDPPDPIKSEGGKK